MELGFKFGGPLVLASFISIAIFVMLPIMHFFIFPIQSKKGCFVFSPLLKMYYGQIAQATSLAIAALIEFTRNTRPLVAEGTTYSFNSLFNYTGAKNVLLQHDMEGAYLCIPMFFAAISFIFNYVGTMEYIYASTPAYMRAVGFGFWLAVLGLGVRFCESHSFCVCVGGG